MELYREPTECMHVYANAPGVHGRLMATVASFELAKHYLHELDGIPLDSWQARCWSEDGRHVTVWVSRVSEPQYSEYEEPGTTFTIERVSVVKGILKPDGLLGTEGDGSLS